MTGDVDYPKLHLGTAPDSWGVWYPSDDPLQTPWRRYLDEIVEAGYRYSELGPFGYLPADPEVVREEYSRRDLTLTGGTVFVALHKGRAALEKAKADCRRRDGGHRTRTAPAPRDPARGLHGPRRQRDGEPDADRRRMDEPH